MNLKLKWGAGRLGRTVLTLGAAGITAGGMLLLAAPANAVTGTDPTLGTVILNPTSGTSATTTTWTTTDGCPTGFQSSAVLEEVNLNAAGTAISSPMTFTAASAPFNLTGSNPVTTQPLVADVPTLLSAANVQPGGIPTEWVLKCSSVPSGLGVVPTSAVYWQDINVGLNAAGTTYTASTPAPAVNTTTTLASSANPTNTGTSITLTATVTGTGNPAGTVTFFNGATAINSTPAPVTYVGSTGTATTPVTFSAAGSDSLTATFTPTNTTAFNGSTSAALVESVNASGTQTAGSIPVSVTIAASGALTVTIPTATAVLTPNSGNTQATGNLGTITVSDSRNSFPGFEVYGQETSNFAGTGLPPGATVTSIPSDNLGWAPNGPPAAVLAGGATAGPTTADIGLTAGPAELVLAHAGTGFGTDTLNPFLTLTLPAGTPTGTFTGAVTITYVTSLP